nr:hypothetical protein B0A51_01997 [Rachicladosporium sp. CCFEE 5018]
MASRTYTSIDGSVIRGPATGLLEGVENAFASGKYADLTIEVVERKWKVHKVIVCASCEYLERACSGRFQTSVIRLHEDNPDAVNAWLEYLYKQDFTRPSDFKETLELCINVCSLADKYQVRGLNKTAEDTLRTHLKSASDPQLAIAISMYYGEAADVAAPLRLYLDDVVRKNFETLFSQRHKYPEFHAAAARYPDFAANAAEDWTSSRRKVSRFRCGCVSCRGKDLVFEIGESVSQSTYVTCLSGEAVRTKTSWAAWRVAHAGGSSD